jgi:hypothetical protein
MNTRAWLAQQLLSAFDRIPPHTARSWDQPGTATQGRYRPLDRPDDEDAAKPLATEALIDGQAAD